MAVRSGGVRIVGLRELQKALRQLPPELRNDLKRVFAEAAEPVRDEAKRLVPYKTGRLQRSIRSSGTQRTGVVRAGKKSVPHAGVINFGWPKRNIVGRHFMETALANKRNTVLVTVQKGVDRTIDKAFAQIPR